MSDPSAEQAAPESALVVGIKAKFDNKVDVKEVKFHFKKVALTDNEGKEIGEHTKRPTVELATPVPSVEGIIAIIEGGGKPLELLLDAAAEIVIARAREIINEKEDITQDNFPLEQLAWEAIANLPKAERRGGGIGKEVWEDFGKDYLATMPSVTGKTAEQIGNAVKILLAKFAPCKTNKPVLNKLKEQLGIYAVNSPQSESFADCIEFLTQKADTLLAVDDAALLANL